jgi:hypothetical protein
MYIYMLTSFASEGFTLAFLPEGWRPVLVSEVVLGILIMIEIIAIFRGFRRIDNVAHLGGYAAGLAGTGMLENSTRWRKKQAEERERKRQILIARARGAHRSGERGVNPRLEPGRLHLASSRRHRR